MGLQKERQTIILDANVILRYLLQDNAKLYPQAEEIFNKSLLGDIKLFIPIFVFAEVVYVLQKVYKVDRPTISEVLSEILEIKSVKTEDKDILRKALEIYASKNLDFADCLLCAYSLRFEVVSFDEGVNKCIKSLKQTQ
jgi:predicted nucleic-acid-binding protein